MDIKSAYLNGIINEDIYMQQPKGYNEKGEEDKGQAQERSLQAEASQKRVVHYTTLHDFLIQLGFTQTHADHCFHVPMG